MPSRPASSTLRITTSATLTTRGPSGIVIDTSNGCYPCTPTTYDPNHYHQSLRSSSALSRSLAPNQRLRPCKGPLYSHPQQNIKSKPLLSPQEVVPSR